MSPTPEQKAREHIDALLEAAGWHLCDAKAANIHAGRGVAIREFPLQTGHGFADYLLYVDGRAAGVIEAKKVGSTLSGVEVQSRKYTEGLPEALPAWHRPLPFHYQSTGIETRITNRLDPEPRARNVFAFHRPEGLAKILEQAQDIPLAADDLKGHGHSVGTDAGEPYGTPQTFLARLRHMPELVTEGLWPAQIIAVRNLEASLRLNKPRALIQMATGSGKTFTAISFIYRLIKFAGARRVLFLVDRGNLGDQTLKEFQQYVSPYNNFKFTEEFIVQRLASNVIDAPARVCICTIQRMFSMLKGRELSEEDDEASVAGLEGLFKSPEPIEYNPAIPIETFDVIVTDECHRSIYNLWAQVLEYFDAYLIGLTATPSKQTFGFFKSNLVMEYPHERAVADGVNVNYDVYRIRTAISEAGSTVEAGYYVQKQDKETFEKRWEELDEEFAYDPNQLDRDVVTPDQIRTIARTFRDKLFTEIFPGRTEVPKTLVFAKDDHHAENIVGILREEFGKGNEFCQKITYRTTGATPQALIKAFRNSYHPRVAVTVDMIATGTDIKPVEIVFFMRAVKSRSFFEQMKGRGVRVISPDDLKSVTPDAVVKDHFVIVDAVGVCEQDKTDAKPMEKKPSVSFEKLLQAVAFGNIEEEVISSVAGRLARMEHGLREEDEVKVREASGGLSVKDLSRRLVEALDPDRHVERAKATCSVAEPTPEQIAAARTELVQEAVKPLHDPKLRQLLVEVKKKNEITIDHVSQDQVIEAGFSQDALDRARGLVDSFEAFLEEHKDEVTALQVLYSRPYAQRLTFEAVKELAEAIEKPPYLWNESQLWQAYAALEKSKVRGAGGKRILTDLVSLVRFAMHQENELVPFPERVSANFRVWLGEQEEAGRTFTDQQRRWLEMIRDHIAANLGIEPDDFEYAPFAQEGGLGKVHQLFGDELGGIIESLNGVLAA
ncbi:MAG: type I restriction-modification enzyme R subunit C-terminal domain-containing protein [Deferrisomatales bacterium]|nr:type I restriction-modification enzyme R subunit C-terminal domain-containing protein [Deferrisomatales bacterium]